MTADARQTALHNWLLHRSGWTCADIWDELADLRLHNPTVSYADLPLSADDLAAALKRLAIAGMAEEAGGRWKYRERVERETERQGSFGF